MAAGSMAKATTHRPIGHTGQGLWRHKGVQLPAYIQHVAGDLIAKHGESKAIKMAVGIVRNWKDGHDGKGHKVTATTQAAAAKAWAEWEALKARFGGGKGKKVVEAAETPPEITDDDLAQMAAQSARNLAVLELAGLSTTGPGAEFDRLLVEAALPAAARVKVQTRGGRTVDVSASHARRMHENGTLAPGQTGKFDESKHPRGGKGSPTGGKFVSKGASGTEVRAIQRRVGARVDGAFGDKTRTAVMSFQKKHGLAVDGVVGRQTVAAMRGRRDAKRVTTGSLSSRDRQFLTGHIRGKGRTATKLVEAVAAPAFLERVRGLELGELARLPDGRAVKHHASEDGRDLWSAGGPYDHLPAPSPDSVDWSSPLRTAEAAVAKALSASAASTDPASLGGTTSYGVFTSVTVNGNPARFAGVGPDCKPLVRYDGSDDAKPTTWPALAPAP